jgi:hypothetical protein
MKIITKKYNSGFTMLQVTLLVVVLSLVMGLQAKLKNEQHRDKRIQVATEFLDELKVSYSDYYEGYCGVFASPPSIATLKSQGYLRGDFNSEIPSITAINLGAFKGTKDIQFLTISATYETPAYAKYAWNSIAGAGSIKLDNKTLEIAFIPSTLVDRGASYTWFSDPNCT